MVVLATIASLIVLTKSTLAIYITGYNDVIKSRLETTEDQILTRHQRKLKLKKLEDQLNEENELILDLIKLYQQEAQSHGKEPDLVGDLLDVEKRHEHALVQPETLSSSAKKNVNKKDLEYTEHQWQWQGGPDPMRDPSAASAPTENLFWQPRISFRKENPAKHISSLANEQKLEYMGNELNENKRHLQEELQLQNVGHPPAN